jgi:hypothetical protein
MKIFKTQERDDGIYDFFLYNEEQGPNHGGFWVRREDDWKQELRVPLACRACTHLLMNWDTQFHHKWGVCHNCYYDFLEGRDNLPAFRTNMDRSAYCKARIEEKNTKIKESA